MSSFFQHVGFSLQHTWTSHLQTILTDDLRPVIFNGTGLIPPATAINFVPWA